jgi:transcriptional regulator with XRE-family HTH domain
MEHQDNGDQYDTMAVELHVGSRLRDMRLKSLETLADVAKALGMSTSQLSRLERGEQQLTVVELMRFAHHFDVPVTTFFLDFVAESVKVTRATQRPRLVRNVTSGEPVVQELLLRAENVKMEPSFLHIPAYGDSGAPITHDGEEFLTVIEGALIVWVGEQRYELATGDTIYYLCSVPHRWQNPSAIPSKILAVSTPPSY